MSPKEISLVTGNEVETIYRVLSLVDSVFARADDSLMTLKSLSLPLCSLVHRDRRPVMGEDSSG